MANEQVAIRLTTQGGEQILRVLEQIGAAAETQFRRAAGEARAFSREAANLVASPIPQTAMQIRANAFAGVSPRVTAQQTEERGADVERAYADADRLRAKYSPLFGVEREHLQTLNEIDAALRSGAINYSEAANAVDRLGAAYEKNRASLVASLQAPLNERLGVRDDFGTAQRSDDIAAYGAELDRLRSKYSPLFALEKQHLETVSEIERAARTGAISHSEAANAVDRLSTAYEKNRAAQVAAIQAQMNDRIGVRDDFNTAQRGADVAAAFGDADRIRARYSPLFSAQRDYLTNLREIRSALKAGVLAENEATAAIDRTKKAFVSQVEEIRSGPSSRENGRSTREPKDRFDRWDWINFYRQGSDIGVSLQGGQDPLLVLAQQGTQIADIFLAQERGPIKALKEFGSTVTRFALNPVTLFTASLAGLGYAAYRYGDQQAELNRSLNGVGRSAGASAGQLRSISDTAARSGAISQGQAVSAAAQYASAGIGVENIPTLLADTRRFSHAFGLDMDAAQKEIAQIVSEEGLGAFEKRFGAVSFATKEWVRALEQSGRFAEAAAVKTRLLDEETQKAKDSAGLLTRVWEPVSTAISNAFGAIGAGIDALIPKFQRVELPRAAQAAAQAPGMGSLSDYERRIGLAPEVTPAQSARNLQELNKRSDLAGRTIDALTPEEGQRRGFQRQLDLLKPFTESAEGMALLGDRAGALKPIVSDLSKVLAEFETPAQKMRRDSELATQSIGAYSFEQRKAVAEETAYRQTWFSTQKDVLAAIARESAGNAMLAESRRRLDDMSREAEDRAQLRGLSPLQASQREIETRFTRLREQSNPADVGRINDLQRNARLDLLSQTATQALDTARPDLAQLRQINDARAAISELLNDKDGLAALGPRAEEARQALDNLANRMSVWRSQSDTIMQDAALQAKATEAYTFAQRQLVAQQQAWLSVMRQSGDATVAAAEAEKARISLIAQGNRAADDLLRQAKNESALIGKTPYEAGLERIRQQYRDFREQNAPTGSATDYRSSLPPAILSPIETGFKAAGDAANVLAGALSGAASVISGSASPTRLGAPSTSPTASAANVVPLFARTNDLRQTVMRAEGTTRFGDPYNTSLGYRPSPKPLVEMTMRESLAWGEEIARQEMVRTRKPREDVSSAKGAYQIVNSTQQRAMRALGIGDNELFNAANQDRMFSWIMRTQGPGAWEGLKRPGADRIEAPVTSRVDSQSRAAQAEAERVYRWSQSGAQLQSLDAQITSHIRTIEMQRAAVTQDDATLRGLNEAQELYNRFAEQRKDVDTALVEVSENGATSTMKLTDAILKYGERSADAARKEEENARARSRYIAELDIGRSAINEGFTGPLKALSRGEDPGAAALSALQATQDRLIDFIGGQFTESLLGKTGTANTGVLGSLFGFGGQQNVAQATINAGVVNVNGGVSGAVGAAAGGSGGGLFGWLGNLFGGGSIPTMAQGGYGPDMPVGFADGGVMTSAGALQMQRSSAGGVADRPQLALFGEGRYPEAYIPMRDGRSISVAVDDAGRAHAELPGGRGVPVTLRGALADRSQGGRSLVSAFADGGVMTAQGQATGQFYRSVDRPAPHMPVPVMPRIQMASPPAAAPNVYVTVEKPPVPARTEETTDAKGNRRIRVVFEESVASAMTSPNGRDAMAAYGARPRLARR